MKRLRSTNADFAANLRRLTAWHETEDPEVVGSVDAIVRDVIERGDQAVLEYSHRFDGLSVDRVSELEVQQERLQAALASIPAEPVHALTPITPKGFEPRRQLP